MSFELDFGYESRSSSWEDSFLALLFACNATKGEIGKIPGPTAVADTSRFVELFEMQSGIAAFDYGVYAEVVEGKDPVSTAVVRAVEAQAQGMFPVIIAENRRITEQFATAGSLVAMWGKIGRAEADEKNLFRGSRSILAGVRSATTAAFKSVLDDVTLITAKDLLSNNSNFKEALAELDGPVHLSIDIDVLSPGVIQNIRSVEPGGLTWYALVDTLQTIIDGPGISGMDLVGTASVVPRTPAAFICAQLLMKIAGLLAAGIEQ